MIREGFIQGGRVEVKFQRMDRALAKVGTGASHEQSLGSGKSWCAGLTFLFSQSRKLMYLSWKQNLKLVSRG